jgi:two-component system, NtrC family, sensor histidine kinase HydH
VRRVAGILRADAERHQITLKIADGEPCAVQGGEEAASDIVSNLLVNALEASAEGTAICIGIRPATDSPYYVELSVEDQGRGVPADELGKIFQPFFTTRPGGTGLGLAIVKRRVDEIGGSVACESPAEPGSNSSAHPGTRFVVRFRVANASGQPAGISQQSSVFSRQ